MPYYIQAPSGVIAVLIRHAPTVGNDAPVTIVRGWRDEEIAPEGHLMAQLTGEKLKPFDIKYIVSSDFMRDQQTAHIIAEKLNVSNIDVDYDARTWDTGDFSGRPETEVNPAIVELYKRPWETPPGGSETFNDFAERWMGFLEAKLYQAANVDQFRPTAIVTHGRNLAYTQSYLEGIHPLNCEMPLPAGFASIVIRKDRTVGIQFETETEPVITDV